MTSRGKHTQGLKPPWKKGQSGNPRGRPPTPWRPWLTSQEPGFREALAALARDARIKPETRARILMFFVDHAHGHPKQPVESDWRKSFTSTWTRPTWARDGRSSWQSRPRARTARTSCSSSRGRSRSPSGRMARARRNLVSRG